MQQHSLLAQRKVASYILGRTGEQGGPHFKDEAVESRHGCVKPRKDAIRDDAEGRRQMAPGVERLEGRPQPVSRPRDLGSDLGSDGVAEPEADDDAARHPAIVFSAMLVHDVDQPAEPHGVLHRGILHCGVLRLAAHNVRLGSVAARLDCQSGGGHRPTLVSVARQDGYQGCVVTIQEPLPLVVLSLQLIACRALGNQFGSREGPVLCSSVEKRHPRPLVDQRLLKRQTVPAQQQLTDEIPVALGAENDEKSRDQ